MLDLKKDYTVVIVTHNMQQATRVADMTAFFSVEVREDGTGRHGMLVEYDATTTIFTKPVRPAYRGLRDRPLRIAWRASSTSRASRRSKPSLQEEGAVVLRSVRAAVDALESQDVELCDEVVAFDDEIDTSLPPLSRRWSSEVLAQQSPVATDLRLVRHPPQLDPPRADRGPSGTVAKLTKLSAELEPRQDLVEGLREMGERADEMVRSRSIVLRAGRRGARAHWSSSTSSSTGRTEGRRQGAEDAQPPGRQEWGMRMIVVATLPRADRRQRRRHRRADRVRRHGRVPRVHRRVALTALRCLQASPDITPPPAFPTGTPEGRGPPWPHGRRDLRAGNEAGSRRARHEESAALTRRAS